MQAESYRQLAAAPISAEWEEEGGGKNLSVFSRFTFVLHNQKNKKALQEDNVTLFVASMNAWLLQNILAKGAFPNGPLT